MAATNENAILSLKQDITQLQAVLAMNGKTDVATLAQQEIGYLEYAALTQPAIKQCEPISVLLAIKAVLKKNLSLDPADNLVYIKTRNINTAAPGQQPIWKKALEIQPTANGLISIARQCGRILDIRRPQVIKEGNKVIGGYVEIQLPGIPSPRWEKFEFSEDDIYRWRRASHKENSRGYERLRDDQKANKPVPNIDEMNYANENYSNFYGGIDPEFARAKFIRHALKKLGTNQAEMKPGTMTVNVPKGSMVISPEADKAATSEEFTHYEEVSEIDPNKL